MPRRTGGSWIGSCMFPGGSLERLARNPLTPDSCAALQNYGRRQPDCLQAHPDHFERQQCVALFCAGSGSNAPDSFAAQ